MRLKRFLDCRLSARIGARKASGDIEIICNLRRFQLEKMAIGRISPIGLLPNLGAGREADDAI
jgi:hypothetical protein